MKKVSRLLLIAVIAMAFVFTGNKVIRYVNADANQSVSVTNINYDKMTLTMSGNGDTAYYFSDGKQKKWEKVVGSTESGKTTMDISWISASKDYQLSLKGNVSAKPVIVTIPKYNSKFKAAYNKARGTVTYSGVPSGFTGNIQWHASGESEWKSTPSSPDTNAMNALRDELNKYVNDMTTAKIYFRTAPKEGTSAEATGMRPSKVYVLSLSKKATAPTIKIDGKSLCVTVPAGVQYRVVNSGNTSSFSTPKASVETINIKDIVGDAFKTQSNTTPVDKIIEFRAEANSKKMISSSTFVRINAQESKEAVGLGSVTSSFLSGSSIKFEFTVEEAMKDNKYEYAITKSEDGSTEAPAFDKDTKWNDLRLAKDANDATKYKASKVFTSENLKTNDKIWIRRKTTGTVGSDKYKIASEPYSCLIGSYPGESSASGTAQNIVAVKNTEYVSELTLSYSVDKSIAEANTRVSSVKIAETATSSAITLPSSAVVPQEPAAGTESGNNRLYTLKITKEGITSLLANSSIQTDKVYTFFVNLVSGESVKMNTTLKVLTDTVIVGDKDFIKVVGYDKSFDLTLNLGTKLVNDYDITLSCGDTSIMPTTITYVDASGATASQNTATYAKIKFSVQDGWLVVGAKKDIKVELRRKNTSEVVETVTGATAELKKPVTIASNGSTTFSQGMRSTPITFTLNVINDEQVTSGFTITDIIWKGVSSGKSLISGSEINQSGTTVSVSVSKDALNSLTDGSSNLYLKIKSRYNNIDYVSEQEISYVITVTAPVSSGSTSAASGSNVSSSSYSLRGNRAAGTNKGAEPAVTSDKVEFAGIDYVNNQIKIKLNGNDMAFYSTNKKKWYGVEGTLTQDGIVKMNINWMSDTKNYTLYFKGTKSVSEDDYVKVVVPKKNTKIKVKFDKTSPADNPVISIENRDEAVTNIQWKKYCDYEWKTLAVNNSTSNADTYKITDLEYLRVKGGKIVVRTYPVSGTDADHMGNRYSKEVTLSIPKRGNAPGVKINAAKLTLNTSDTIEYYDTVNSKWVACTRNMSIWNIPSVNANVKANDSNAGTDVSVEFRKKATERAGYSKIATVIFKGQAKKPTLGTETTNDITYGTERKTVNKKEVTYQTITFNKASSTNKYQYAIVMSGSTFDASTAKWITVSKNTKITLSTSKAVTGTKIYVRTMGVNANTKLKTEAKLPSAVNSYTIS